MALIALAADKGAPGVTTAAVALGAVWPRPVLVAECDQAGGDLVYRLPAASPADGDGDGGMLNPSRGLLSLAATARRGLRPDQIAEHCQRLAGRPRRARRAHQRRAGAGDDLAVGAARPGVRRPRARRRDRRLRPGSAPAARWPTCCARPTSSSCSPAPPWSRSPTCASASPR
ncbi:hypothetical protein [Actinomadura madurae]|uniref:hypothetical protein n=1 Tax=Actinomadura madurae TaxID=1993 RepID=UPI0020D24DEE|nr:hypothetical protein [Actinomadura madurae]MCP9979875.1 hypothetical protein [Actinomadura madurae]